jgi:hypothetical protein
MIIILINSNEDIILIMCYLLIKYLLILEISKIISKLKFTLSVNLFLDIFKYFKYVFVSNPLSSIIILLSPKLLSSTLTF